MSFLKKIIRSLSTAHRQQIDQIVKENRVVLFMKGTKEQPMCGFSRGAAMILEMNGLKFKDINVLEQYREEIKEYSEWPTIPQVYIDGEFVGGFDILKTMHESGQMDKFNK